ncbi:MAG: PQQ-dependent dehydrogenase, methanol/ethanol family [Woeseia sp.]
MDRRVIAATCLFFLASSALAESSGNVTQQRVLAEAAEGENWFLNGGNFRGEHFSPLTQINDRNVLKLGLAWSRDLPAPDGIAATPIVVDGTIYLSAPRSVVFAIDAASGEMRWTYDPELHQQFAEKPYLSWRSRANRGVAVWGGKVFVGTADCRLIALDAGDGREVWSRLSCDPALGYGISDAPHVGGGKVFVGNAGSESGQKNRGYVTAYDADDGQFLWRFFTVPSDDPEQNRSPAMRLAAKTWSGDAWQKYGGGGSPWNEMSYNPESNLLLFGTAGALPYVYELRNPAGGDNLFSSSVLAVNADSGEYVWHYQTVPQDSWDYNATMNIVLADLTIDEKKRKVAMIAPKNGFFYVLDRLTGELISAEKYAKVNWATHINPETGRPELDPAGMFWKLPEGTTTAIWPNMWGAHSWQPMAYHPGHELVYIPVIDTPQIVTNLRDGDYIDTMELIDEVDGMPHSPGKLVAWDPVRQTKRWSVDHDLAVSGGVLATAGNLVFQGNGTGEFDAFDAQTGKKLWSVSTGTAISAAPVSYRLAGDQFILIPAGLGGVMQFFYPELHTREDVQGPTRLFAFKLDGGARMPGVETVEREVADLSILPVGVEGLELGAELYADECLGCHGKDATARFGGTVPDLRYATVNVFETWHAIVIGGAAHANGMPSFDLSVEQAEAIRDYVIFQARKIGSD